MVDAGDLGDNLVRVVEIFVVTFHVIAIGVGDRDIIGEFGGAKDLFLAESGGGAEDALGGVGSV